MFAIVQGKTVNKILYLQPSDIAVLFVLCWIEARLEICHICFSIYLTCLSVSISISIGLCLYMSDLDLSVYAHLPIYLYVSLSFYL